MATDSLALSRADKELYQEHKKFIREHAENWVKVWGRVVEIRDKKWYLAEYATFKDFCRDVFNLGDRMVRYYMEGAREVEAMALTGTQVPTEKSLRRARAVRKKTIEVEATVTATSKPEPDRFAGMSRRQLVRELLGLSHQLRLADHDNRFDRMKKIIARLISVAANLQRALHHPTQVLTTR